MLEDENMEKIYELLNKVRPNTDFRKSDNYIDDGLLDSLEIIELIDVISEEYGIEIKPEDIFPDNFSTVDGIWGMIQNYVQQ